VTKFWISRTSYHDTTKSGKVINFTTLDELLNFINEQKDSVIIYKNTDTPNILNSNYIPDPNELLATKYILLIDDKIIEDEYEKIYKGDEL